MEGPPLNDLKEKKIKNKTMVKQCGKLTLMLTKE